MIFFEEGMECITNEVIGDEISSKFFAGVTFDMYFDGASKGNPGEAGAGYVFYDQEGKEILGKAQYLGIKSNNEAEYSALILGLKMALKLGVTHLYVIGDSQLIIKQMKREYKISKFELLRLNKIAIELASKLEKVEFQHVIRKMNWRADELSNIALIDKIKQIE